MIQAPKLPLDTQLGLELQRAIAEGDGDKAVMALADLIRSQQMIVSEDALAFIGAAVKWRRAKADTPHSG